MIRRLRTALAVLLADPVLVVSRDEDAGVVDVHLTTRGHTTLIRSLPDTVMGNAAAWGLALDMRDATGIPAEHEDGRR